MTIKQKIEIMRAIKENDWAIAKSEVRAEVKKTCITRATAIESCIRILENNEEAEFYAKNYGVKLEGGK